MAKLTIQMPDEFLQKVSRLAEKTDTILPKVLEAGGAVVLPKVKSNLQAAVGSNTKYESRSTGELIDALGVTTPKQDRDGNFNVKIGFAEPRKNSGKVKSISNAMLAGILEYGKSGQPPKPFLKPAKTATKKPCIAAMTETLEREIENL
ncbi:MAG TPA: HK97-gp10 family putative phage morphogenesis protein [Caproicibacter sp.]|nr:HK97-gp10 family putative phage morphogenesis protein [Caproicibacter sp.]